MAKLKFEGNVFAGLLEKLDGLGGDVEKAIEDSLEQSAELVARNAEAAIGKHRRTGHTESTILKSESVQKSGVERMIRVGFDLPEGLTSVFLMYGTPRHAADRKLYNAVYGTKTKKEIREKQSQVINNAIRRMEG
ncbi:MAG: hypothetical protein K2M46_10470 [Lachnospiraceae bacterium]|nr:hypothetical protein [Lachnospiraceae bacterium]